MVFFLIASEAFVTCLCLAFVQISRIFIYVAGSSVALAAAVYRYSQGKLYKEKYYLFLGPVDTARLDIDTVCPYRLCWI